MKAFYFLSILLCLASCQTNLYNLVLHQNRQLGGACLDGSAPGLYFHEGSQTNKDKFLVYFQGGGYCGGPGLANTLQDCYQRSQGNLGSTKSYPKQSDKRGSGILSPLKQQNQLFYDWTKIVIIYCDGSEYQGSRKDPIPYKDALLHFRGKNNVLQQFNYLNKTFDIYNKDKIVITGKSAGGIATYFWANFLFQNSKSSKVYAIPDSGLFITNFVSPFTNQSTIRQCATTMMELANMRQQFTIQQCIADFKGDFVQCFNSANVAKYLKPPFFMIQSPYDQWAVSQIVSIQCLSKRGPPYSLVACNDTQRAAIQQYRRLSLEAIYKIKGDRKDVGIWGPACVQHGFDNAPSFSSSKYKVPTNIGLTASEAISQFINDPYNAKWNLDTIQWPGNTGCSGLNLIHSEQK